METTERKKPQLDLNTRAAILRRLEAGENVKLLAAEYSVSKSTIWYTKKNEKKILKKEKDPNSLLDPLNKRLLRWVLSKREKGFAVTGVHMKKMAKVINDRLGAEGKPDFTASNGWLYRFLHRTGIKLKDAPDGDTSEEIASTAVEPEKEKIKRTRLGNEDKLVILKRLQAGEATREQLAVEFGVGQSTISKIKKMAEEGFDFKVDLLEKQLAEWIKRKQEEDIKLTGANIREMAITINERLGKEGRPDFTASNGWLYRFLYRIGIKLKELTGNALSESVPMEIVEENETGTVELQDVDSDDLIEEDPPKEQTQVVPPTHSGSSSQKGGDKQVKASPCNLQPIKKPPSNGLGIKANLRNQDRLNILARLEAGEKAIHVAAEYHVSPSIISNIKKRAQEGHTFKGDSDLMESRLVQWIIGKQEEDIKLTGNNIREMAVEINDKLGKEGVPAFTASNGWLYRFLNRTGIQLKDLPGKVSVRYAIGGSSSSAKDTQKKSHLSSEDRLAILKKLQAGETSLVQLASKYGVTTNTIYNIRKRLQGDYKPKITKSLSLEKRLTRWIHSKQRKGLALSNKNIQKMALVINDRLGDDEGIPDFVASKRWLYGFFDRNNISFKERSGGYGAPKEIDSDLESQQEEGESSTATTPDQISRQSHSSKLKEVMSMRDPLEIQET